MFSRKKYVVISLPGVPLEPQNFERASQMLVDTKRNEAAEEISLALAIDDATEGRAIPARGNRGQSKNSCDPRKSLNSRALEQLNFEGRGPPSTWPL